MIRSFITNLKIELTLRKSRISTYIYFLLMVSIAFLYMMVAGGFFKNAHVSLGGSAKAAVNGPFMVHMSVTFISLFGLLIVGPIFGQAICKDYEAKIDQIVFSTPTHRIGFYLGRYFGAIAVSLLIFSGIGIGLWLGSYLPGLQRSLFTTGKLSYYVVPYLTSVLPNIVIFGSLFFAIAAFTRRMGAVYVGGILLFLGYLFSTSFTDKVDHRMVQALIDPFGLSSSLTDTEYWSPFDQNSKLVALQGYFLINRLVFGGFSMVMLAIALVLTQTTLKRKTKAGTNGQSPAAALGQTPAVALRYQATPLDFSQAARWRLLIRQLGFEIRAAFKNIYFLCLALAGVIFMLTTTKNIGSFFGTPTMPVTYNILETTGGTFMFFMIAIQIFYTGELIWRERQHRMDQILDALPQPGWLSIVSKFLTLQVIILIMIVLTSLTGMVIQMIQGYTHFELGQVLRTQLTIYYPRFLISSAIFMFIHVFTNNKYLGHTIGAAYVLALLIVPNLGVEHDMLLPGAVSSRVAYSDMNGYGPFLLRLRSYQLYWGLAAAGLLIASYLLWPYGTDSAIALRKKLARERWHKPLQTATLVIALAFIAQGGFIYYNTMVLNEFHTEKYRKNLQANYERTYKAEWDRRDQLQFTAVNVKADLFPSETRLDATVDYTLQNKSAGPIDKIMLIVPLEKKDHSIAFDRPVELVKFDEDNHIQIYAFKEAVAPGALVKMKFTMQYQAKGFAESGQETNIVANGTFFNSKTFFPSIGYSSGRELSTDKDREKYGFQPKPDMNPITDVKALDFTYISSSGNWIDFEATLSTSPDQIAIAPGYLDKEWTEGQRRYFHYKMDRKILDFYAFQSARYEVKKDRWNDVPIEIYYHKGHEYNLDRMIMGAKEGLDYFTKNFGPYQHRQFRILEFPRYDVFAQSFPNTVPFSEQIGFIAKVDDKDPDDFDYPFYVTAHELAHQWWAHQVIGGDVQGSTVLVETMAQYSATMVIEKRYGKEKVERMLRHELQRYLMGRTSEGKREWPLVLNEGQNYIHYGKGALVMYTLKEIVGEDALNAAIRKFADQVRFQEPPFTTAPALVDSLKSSLDPKFGPLIDDLFNKVILYDNRIQSHTVKEEKDGSVTVDLEILGRKLSIDEKGEQNEVEFAQEMQIAGRLDDKFMPGNAVLIKSGVNKFQLHFAQKPKSISLDPVSMWIDLNRDDNKFNL